MITFLTDNPVIALSGLVLLIGIIIYIKAGAQQEKNRIKAILEADLGSCPNPSKLEKLIKNKNKYGDSKVSNQDLSSAIIAYINNQKFEKFLKVILTTGGDINATSSTHKMAPLPYCILNSHEKQAKVLERNGADLSKPNSQGVHLMGLASESGNIEAIQYLIQQGWDINIADEEMNSPITYALRSKQQNVANFLIDQKINLNSQNNNSQTPLLISVEDGNSDTLIYLVSKGADVNIRSAEGLTPLQIAMDNNNSEVFNLLLDAKANVSLDDATMALDTDNHQIVYSMFSSIDFEQPLGVFLYDATLNQQLNSISALIETGADVDHVVSDFLTPAILASMIGNQQVLDIVLPHTTLSPFSKLINYIPLSDGKVGLNLNKLELSEVGGEIIYDSKAAPGSLHWEIATREVEKILGLSDIRLKDNKDETFSVLFYNKTNLGQLAKTLIVRGSEVNFVKIVNTEASKNIIFKNIPGSKISDWFEQQGFIEDILGVAVEVEQYNNDHDLFPDLGRDKLIIIKESNVSAIPSSLGLTGEFIKEAKSKGIAEIHFGNVSDSNAWQSKTDAISNILNRKIQVVSDGTKVILRDSIESSIPSLLDWDDNKDTPVLLHTVEKNGNTDYFYSYSHDRDLNKWKEASRKVSFKTLFNQPDKVYKLAMYDRSNNELFNPSFSTEQMIVLHEYASIPNKDKLMSFNPQSVMKKKDVFWGYGTGSKKYYTSIDDLPHMMIIGASGSGKSNFINGLILSLLNNISDIQKMYLVDLKSGIEFNRYKDLNPDKISVFSKGTSPSKFLASLQEVEAQMYLREEYMVQNNIIKLNDDPIFIIIDEYAQIQLMHARGEDMMAKDEIVDTLIRIGTRARSANIKLIVQTQDPRAVEDELKVHLMSRALLKTSKENDMAFTLQNEDLAIEMGIKHTQFDKGRFVFEDYNDGDTKLEELQFPYIDPSKKYHLNFDMSMGSSKGLDIAQFTSGVASEYPYLSHTEILNNADGTPPTSIKESLRSEPTVSDSKPFDFNALLSATEDDTAHGQDVDEADEAELKEIDRLQSESLEMLKELLEE